MPTPIRRQAVSGCWLILAHEKGNCPVSGQAVQFFPTEMRANPFSWIHTQAWHFPCDKICSRFNDCPHTWSFEFIVAKSCFCLQADGHCMYRAVEDQLEACDGDAVPYEELREETASYMRAFPDDFRPFVTQVSQKCRSSWQNSRNITRNFTWFFEIVCILQLSVAHLNSRLVQGLHLLGRRTLMAKIQPSSMTSTATRSKRLLPGEGRLSCRL